MKKKAASVQNISKLYSEIKREREDFASPQRANHLLRAQAQLAACPWWIMTKMKQNVQIIMVFVAKIKMVRTNAGPKTNDTHLRMPFITLSVLVSLASPAGYNLHYHPHYNLHNPNHHHDHVDHTEVRSKKESATTEVGFRDVAPGRSKYTLSGKKYKFNRFW